MSDLLWGTITGTSPLRVRLDGDSAALLVTPDTLVNPLELAVDDRVRVELANRRVVILGVAGGGQLISEVPDLLDDVDALTAALALGFRLVQRLTYTASSTFTKASFPWLAAIIPTCQGGGGAGGGRSTSYDASGGGGGGGCAELLITDIASLSSSVAITIGAGGTGVSAGNGNAGGSTSFGSLVIGDGGAGGPRGDATYGGAGGYGTGGRIYPGSRGGTARSGVNAGSGGDSHFGQGGPGRHSGVGTGNGSNAGPGYGGGGAGGYGPSTGFGGDGAAGVAYLELFA